MNLLHNMKNMETLNDNNLNSAFSFHRIMHDDIYVLGEFEH